MDRIHVSVRARPLSTEDAKTSPWKISSDSIFMPNHPSPAFEFGTLFSFQFSPPLSLRFLLLLAISMPNFSLLFITDRIFREDCKTVQVYEARTKEIVAAAVRGFNGTILLMGLADLLPKFEFCFNFDISVMCGSVISSHCCKNGVSLTTFGVLKSLQLC